MCVYVEFVIGFCYVISDKDCTRKSTSVQHLIIWKNDIYFIKYELLFSYAFLVEQWKDSVYNPGKRFTTDKNLRTKLYGQIIQHDHRIIK
jgi:hypothetical protein